MAKKETIVVATLVVALSVCAIGAAGTAVWTLRFGLFGPRPPLSAFDTVVRFAIVIAAVGLLVARLDLVERVTLVSTAIAAGSSALFGVGIRSPALSAVRLIFHFAAYSMAAVAIMRMLLVLTRRWRGATSQPSEALRRPG
jgi:hypothetical protein